MKIIWSNSKSNELKFLRNRFLLKSCFRWPSPSNASVDRKSLFRIRFRLFRNPVCSRSHPSSYRTVAWRASESWWRHWRGPWWLRWPPPELCWTWTCFRRRSRPSGWTRRSRCPRKSFTFAKHCFTAMKSGRDLNMILIRDSVEILTTTVRH